MRAGRNWPAAPRWWMRYAPCNAPMTTLTCPANCGRLRHQRRRWGWQKLFLSHPPLEERIAALQNPR